MLMDFLLNLIPFKSHRKLNINYSRIYSRASPAKTNYRKDLKVKDLKAFKVDKHRFIELGLGWCEKNLGKLRHGYTIKSLPNFSRNGGTYSYDDKSMRFRVWESCALIDLVEIIIHEYIHYLQIKSRRINQLYDKLHEELGYENNPYEIEARFVADKLKQVCLNSLLTRLKA